MRSGIARFQIGKNGISEGVIDSLVLAFKHHKQVRVSFLKSSKRDRESMRAFALELEQRLPVRRSSRILGFTIILSKARGSK